MTLDEKALIVCDRLEEKYPGAVCSLEYRTPLQLLIAGRLSAQCTDERVNIVTKDLFARYKTIDDFADANISDIEDIIRPCGLYRTKARSIVEMCGQLRDDFDYEIPQTIDELTTLSGVGRKIANLVIGDVYHKPAVVTDTHCIRICKRLGLTDTDNPAKAERELREILPPERSSDFCHRTVLFGREVCKAKNKRCGQCILNDICPSADKD